MAQALRERAFQVARLALGQADLGDARDVPAYALDQAVQAALDGGRSQAVALAEGEEMGAAQVLVAAFDREGLAVVSVGGSSAESVGARGALGPSIQPLLLALRTVQAGELVPSTATSRSSNSPGRSDGPQG